MAQAHTMNTVVDKAIDLLGERGLAKQEGRIAFQKVSLLIQTLQGEHRYRFLWGLYGPYSATLAEDMHERLAASVEGDPSAAKTDFLTEVANLPENHGKLTGYDLLELVASFAYFKNNLGASETDAVELLARDPRKRGFLETFVAQHDLKAQAAALQRALEDTEQLVKKKVAL